MVNIINQVHVVPNPNEGWDVKSNGSKRAYKHFINKKDAVSAATVFAKNKKAELLVHNKDGKIAYRNSYGNDPRNIKG